MPKDPSPFEVIERRNRNDTLMWTEKRYHYSPDEPEPPPVEPPPVEPPPVEPPPVDPPPVDPPTEPTAFFSDWSHAMGGSKAAVTDGGKWTEDGSTRAMVVTSNGLEIPNTPNAHQNLIRKNFFDFSQSSQTVELWFLHPSANRDGSFHWMQDPPPDDGGGSMIFWFGRSSGGFYIATNSDQALRPGNWQMNTGERFMYTQPCSLPVDQWLRLTYTVEVLLVDEERVVARIFPIVRDETGMVIATADDVRMRINGNPTMQECYDRDWAWVLTSNGEPETVSFSTVSQTGADAATMVVVRSIAKLAG